MKKIKSGKSSTDKENYAYWRIHQSSILLKKSMALELPKRKAYSIEFIQRSLTLFKDQADQVDLDFFIQSTTELISKIPENKVKDKEELFAYYKALAIHKDGLRSHYQVVPRGYYLSIFLPSTMVLVLPATLFLSPFWLYSSAIGVLGVSTGVLLDWNRSRKNRVI